MVKEKWARTRGQWNDATWGILKFVKVMSHQNAGQS
jgi:hypothetical protein